MSEDELVQELKRLGKRIERDQSRRDELIGELYGYGYGLREIARFANLAHTTVLRTLKRDGFKKSGA